jgi:hypothetical protein
LAASAFTENCYGNISTIFRALRPIDPVDPNMERFFINISVYFSLKLEL